MIQRNFWIWAVLALIPAVASSCAPTRGMLVDDVEFDGEDGVDLYQFEGDEKGFKLEDADRKEIADYRYINDALRIENASGTKLGFVLPDGEDLIIVDKDSQELYRLAPEPDGDVRLQSPTALIYKLKRRDDGYKLVDAQDAEVARVKHDDKISIKDPSGKTYLKTKDKLGTLAAACMSFQELQLEHRGALLVGVVAFRTGS